MGGGGTSASQLALTTGQEHKEKFSKPHLVSKKGIFGRASKVHNLRFLRILIFISIAQNLGKIINENKILLVFYNNKIILFEVFNLILQKHICSNKLILS